MKEETKRLYFEDPYSMEFEAVVVERLVHAQKPILVLDQTCFYPEAGGQPSDRGTIDGVEVSQVIEEDNRIFHILEGNITSEKILGKIDWPRRFDHMQQHAGQHILSQSFSELHDAETLSFHLGEVTSTVEINLRNISEEEVEKVEARANKTVFQDREIKTYFVRADEIEGIPLRRPPKKKGLIRVVEITDFDYSACGGTHPKRTGEIGLIKIIKWERIRNNIRFEFVCGQRALEDYAWKNSHLRQLSNLFTVQEKEVLSSVERLLSDLKEQKKKNKKMQQKMIEYEAQDIAQRAGKGIIKNIFTGRGHDEVRFLALNIIRKGDFVVLYGLKGEERIQLILARSENMDIDLREVVPELCSLIKGKGGGRPSLVEITGEKKENLNLALDKACAFIERREKKE
jgi:alanyl-tRNA synthetase